MLIAAIRRSIRGKRQPAGQLQLHSTVPIRSPHPAAGVAFDDIRPWMLEAVTITDGYDRFPGADSGDELGGRRRAAAMVRHQRYLAAQQGRQQRQRWSRSKRVASDWSFGDSIPNSPFQTRAKGVKVEELTGLGKQLRK